MSRRTERLAGPRLLKCAILVRNAPHAFFWRKPPWALLVRAERAFRP
jgi:hypothetical protein